MKLSISKWLLIIPILLFLDWIIMVLFGCFSSVCGAGNSFYCNVYCAVGIALLIFTLLIVILLIFKSLKKKVY